MTASAFVFSCSHHDSNGDTMPGATDGGVIDRARLPAKVYIDASKPDASCVITIDTPPPSGPDRFPQALARHPAHARFAAE